MHSEIVIPSEPIKTRTIPVEDFVLYDSGNEDPKRVIIFRSSTDILRSTWLCDGTFKIRNKNVN